MVNTTNLSNSFHGQNSLKDIIFLVLISGVKFVLSGLRNALINSYIFSSWYKFIHFFLPSNPEMEWTTHQIFCIWDVKSKKSLNLILYINIVFRSFRKLLWDFISELITLKYAFIIFFKITFKTIIMGTSFQFHHGVHFNILL